MKISNSKLFKLELFIIFLFIIFLLPYLGVLFSGGIVYNSPFFDYWILFHKPQIYLHFLLPIKNETLAILGLILNFSLYVFLFFMGIIFTLNIRKSFVYFIMHLFFFLLLIAHLLSHLSVVFISMGT